MIWRRKYLQAVEGTDGVAVGDGCCRLYSDPRLECCADLEKGEGFTSWMPVKYYNARVQYYNARGQVLKCSRCIMGVAAVGWLEVTEEGVCTVHGGVVHDPSGWL